MVNSTILSQVKSLSAADKLELIGAVWETLSPHEMSLTDDEKALIDVRLEDMRRNPDDQIPWTEAAAQLRQQLP